MLPVAVLPAAAILMGIGYYIDPSGWGGGNAAAAFLIKSGSAIIDNMPILFAVGVALGMSKDRDGAAALSGLVAYLVVTTLLDPESVSMLQSIDVEAVNPAFEEIGNQFVGIISGLVAASMYNRFSTVELPDALAFFSGKRSVPIMTSLAMLVVSLVLLFVWPVVFTGLVTFGTGISALGAIGAGLFGFFNRLLIPVGLHHALNSVFWFDVAGIDDIGNFWGGTGVKGVTGMYQAGFFPIMMFGLLGAAFAMYRAADDENKAEVKSMMIAVGAASFLTGVTEPLEFSFMFLAPVLYGAHAVLTGLSLAVASFFQWTAGFSFSAGLADFLLSFKLPLANQPWMLIVQGLVFAALYYFVFTFLIHKFDIKTPGRGAPVSAEAAEAEAEETAGGSAHEVKAAKILQGLGGADNIASLDNCVTRLRIQVKDMDKVDFDAIKAADVVDTRQTGDTGLQVVIGTTVQFVADAMHKMI